MSDGVALSVRSGIGSYRCRWEVPVSLGGCEESEPGDVETRFFPGTLELKGDRWPTGVLFEWTPFPDINHTTSETSYSLPQTFRIPTLRGYLEDNNLEVLLLGVTIRVWDLGQSDISATAALTGIDLTDELSTAEEPRFAGVEVQITNLDAICGYAPLAKTTFPATAKDYKAGVWQATGNGNSSQTWSDGEAKLTFEFYTSSSVFDQYHFRVGFTPIVRIEVAEPLTLHEWVDRWVDPLKRIVSVATGREESITYLAVQHNNRDDWGPGSKIHVYCTGVKQEPVASSQRAVNEAGSSFTVPKDHSSLLGLIRNWHKQSDGNNPILETYNPVMLRSGQHPRARYLLLIPCLEGLYGYQTRSEYEDKAKKHQETRDTLIKRMDALVNNAEVELERTDLKFVKDRLPKRPPQNLTQALTTLFDQVDAGNLLAALKSTTLISSVDNANGFNGNVGDSLRQIRNDLAHGNRGYPAGDLEEVVSILHRIVRAQILRTLGVSEEAQKRALAENR